MRTLHPVIQHCQIQVSFLNAFDLITSFFVLVLPRSRGTHSPSVEKKPLKVNEVSSTEPFYRISSPVFVAKVPFRTK